MIENWPYLLIATISLALAAIFDLATLKTPNTSVLVIILAGLISQPSATNLFISLLAIILGMCYVECSKKISEPAIGYGDIKLISACCLLIPIEIIGCFLLIIGISGLATYLLISAKRLPLTPSIALAFIISCEILQLHL